MNPKQSSVKPFVIGLLVAVGVVAGVVLVRFLSGSGETASQAAGGASGGAVAVVISLCALAAARRRRAD